MSTKLRSRLGFACAFLATITLTALTTSVIVTERMSHAQEPPAAKPAPAPAPTGAGPWTLSAYFVDAKKPTNGFVVINQKTGKVSNCIANWAGKKEARCYDWSSWARLP